MDICINIDMHMHIQIGSEYQCRWPWMEIHMHIHIRRISMSMTLNGDSRAHWYSSRMSMEVEGRRRKEQRRVQTILTAGQRLFLNEPEACSCNADSILGVNCDAAEAYPGNFGSGAETFFGGNRGVSPGSTLPECPDDHHFTLGAIHGRSIAVSCCPWWIDSRC